MLNQQEHFGPPRSEMGKLSTAFATGGLFLFMIPMLRGDKGRFLRSDWKERFLANVDRRGPDECWEWTGSTRRRYGYFFLCTGMKQMGAHRMAYFLGTGQWPDPELFICHDCDNPPCCNPAHLFEGTDLDNKKDALLKGRIKVGEDHGRAKLTWLIVKKIRNEPADMTLLAIGKKYGVNDRSVSMILLNQTWKSGFYIPKRRQTRRCDSRRSHLTP